MYVGNTFEMQTWHVQDLVYLQRRLKSANYVLARLGDVQIACEGERLKNFSMKQKNTYTGLTDRFVERILDSSIFSKSFVKIFM